MPSAKLQRNTKAGPAERQRLRMGYTARIHWTEHDWSLPTWEIVRNAAKKARVTIPWWVSNNDQLRKFFIDDRDAFRKVQAALKRTGYKLDQLQ